MTAPKLFGLSLAAALLLASQSGAQDVNADTVVATVGDKEITVGHMIVAHRTLPEQYTQLPSNVLWEGILEQLIQQNALAQVADAPKEGTRLALENEESSLLAGQVINDALETAITDEALEAIYAEEYNGEEPSKEYNAAHILVSTPDEAAAVKAEIEGGKDFAAAAREHSTGPSGPNGGALGWFGTGMMVAPFEAAVVAMEPGQISDPVETQFGWHIIQLIETRVKDAPDLEEVRLELEAKLRESAIDAEISKALNAANVTRTEQEIDTDVLTNLDLLGE